MRQNLERNARNKTRAGARVHLFYIQNIKSEGAIAHFAHIAIFSVAVRRRRKGALH